MKDWRKILVTPQTSLFETMTVIDQGTMQIALVVDAQKRLLGTVSDGDVRRAILKNISTSAPVDIVMNPTPVVARLQDSREKLREIMSNRGVRQIPIVDEEGRIIRVETWLDAMNPSRKDNPVILMAGGLGKRLGSLTAECPKPLLRVGDKPILQTILESFIEYGFQDFYFSVNYRAEMIKNHFGNGEKWGVEIHYLQEELPLGTAGALGMLPQKPANTIIVMNGDILTKVDFEQLLDFHHENSSFATMCIRDYQTQVPFGVVEVDEHRLMAIHEKPIERYFVSAGIYAFEPDIIDVVAKGNRIDMPELFQSVIKKKLASSVFPIREYWIDIGRMDDYERANIDYAGVFG